jgi:hypothetical protein
MSCVDAGRAPGSCSRKPGRPVVTCTFRPDVRFLSVRSQITEHKQPGSGTLKIACWVGSGPSDPLRHSVTIGNASIGRLAKVVKLGMAGAIRSNRKLLSPPKPHTPVGVATVGLRGESMRNRWRLLGRALIAFATACPYLAGSPLRKDCLPRSGLPCGSPLAEAILPIDSVDSNGGPTLETFASRVKQAGDDDCAKCTG